MLECLLSAIIRETIDSWNHMKLSNYKVVHNNVYITEGDWAYVMEIQGYVCISQKPILSEIKIFKSINERGKSHLEFWYCEVFVWF